jgi:tryptophanyl-tRNA synthetase
MAHESKAYRDGTKKMSKSDPSDQSRIHIKDNKDVIHQKFKRAKTDSIAEITYDPESRPEVANLLTIYSSFSEQNIDNIIKEYDNIGFAKFKEDLAELVANKMAPITAQYYDLMNDETAILEILKEGAEKADSIASKTLASLKKEFGFLC